MSVASPPPPPTAGSAGGTPATVSAPSPAPAPAGEACPLCGAPLHPEQEWCLHCGAAARTRLAASPGWKAPIVAFVVVLVLSLGVLAGALVKLAGASGTVASPTRTVTTAPAAIAPTQTGSVPGTATTPAATTQGSIVPGVRHLDGLSAAVEQRLRKLGLLPRQRSK